jgi:murein DD-endopeptidase MepM/ murein hydrolase activator NlpD
VRHFFQCIATILLIIAFSLTSSAQWLLPLNYTDRSEVSSAKITTIGTFGAIRKARVSIPAHYHTGVDLVRPDTTYRNNPVFPASAGKVISILDNGPYSQVIVRHERCNIWTVYEHIHVYIKDTVEVSPFDTIGFLFNSEELKKYGTQFNHLHFEIMKVDPPRIAPLPQFPLRVFKTYSILCISQADLYSKMEDPLRFISQDISVRK